MKLLTFIIVMVMATLSSTSFAMDSDDEFNKKFSLDITYNDYFDIRYIMKVDSATECKKYIKSIIGEPIFGYGRIVEVNTNQIQIDVDYKYSSRPPKKIIPDIYALTKTNVVTDKHKFKRISFLGIIDSINNINGNCIVNITINAIKIVPEKERSVFEFN